MQVVVVKVRGVCNPGLGLTTFGLVVCAKADPHTAISAAAKRILQIFMVASPLPANNADAIRIARQRHFANNLLGARCEDEEASHLSWRFSVHFLKRS
jgi:hypothetical protein